jgi:hypothetical protein
MSENWTLIWSIVCVALTVLIAWYSLKRPSSYHDDHHHHSPA